ILPQGGRGVLADGRGVIIARTVDEQRFVGRPISADTAAAILGRSDGIYDAKTLEGVWVRATFVKSSVTGWVASYGIEMSALNAPLWRALWQFGGGFSVCAAVALALGLYHSRQIAGPVLALGRMAHGLVRGEPLSDQPLDIVEAQVAADAIRDA